MSDRLNITLNINGHTHLVAVEARRTLADVIRVDCGNTGTHLGCEHGVCGACTVILDGRIVDSCLVLGVEVEGSQLETIEGLSSTAGLHPLQQSFLENAALQCGICTPGFLMAAKALLDKVPNPSEEEIRFWLAGNLCRCTGYDKIIRAVLEATKGKR